MTTGKFIRTDLSGGWWPHLQAEFECSYMQQLGHFLDRQIASGKCIYPAPHNVFNALNSTPLEAVKVVILGQDPYHGAGQAHGLSFSVPYGQAIPPSLRNIYRELAADADFQPPQHGNLQQWASQGVLLLNSVLTVEQGHAASHQGQGWERFTDRVMQVINQQRSGVVFLLWGAYAQAKGQALDGSRHLILSAPHPSPLSAYRGFFGCRHFSLANEYLAAHNKTLVDWQLS